MHKNTFPRIFGDEQIKQQSANFLLKNSCGYFFFSSFCMLLCLLSRPRTVRRTDRDTPLEWTNRAHKFQSLTANDCLLACLPMLLAWAGEFLFSKGELMCSLSVLLIWSMFLVELVWLVLFNAGVEDFFWWVDGIENFLNLVVSCEL